MLLLDREKALAGGDFGGMCVQRGAEQAHGCRRILAAMARLRTEQDVLDRSRIERAGAGLPEDDFVERVHTVPAAGGEISAVGGDRQADETTLGQVFPSDLAVLVEQ